jgi:hypothetical protein
VIELLAGFQKEPMEQTMTYAEQTKQTQQRDDERMIYEMGSLSQYEDGSVLQCTTMQTFTAREVLAMGAPLQPEPGAIFQRSALYLKDLKRNAKAAIKNGKTENRAPLVNW